MAKSKKNAKKASVKPSKKKFKTKEGAKVMKSDLSTQPVGKIASSVEKARTKGEIMRLLSESTGLSKKEVDRVFNSLSELINIDIGKKGPGIFNFPGLMKIVRVSKPATKSRKGLNPFTGEEITFKAKPARNVVKVRALKALKDMVK